MTSALAVPTYIGRHIAGPPRHRDTVKVHACRGSGLVGCAVCAAYDGRHRKDIP